MKNQPNKFLIKAEELINLFDKDDDLWFREEEIKRQREVIRQQTKKKLEELING